MSSRSARKSHRAFSVVSVLIAVVLLVGPLPTAGFASPAAKDSYVSLAAYPIRTDQVEAEMILPKITVSPVPSEGGSVNPGTGRYSGKVTFTAAPNSGYTLLYWTVNGRQRWPFPSITEYITYDTSVIAYFGLVGGIKWLNPTAGQTMLSGTRADLSWQAPDGVLSSVSYWPGDGLLGRSIASGLTVHNYGWIVPTLGVETRQVYLRVWVGSRDYNDYIGSRIVKVSLGLVGLDSPNGGRAYRPGSAVTVSWRGSPVLRIAARSAFYYTTDAGAHWIRMNTVLSSYGSFVWTVPPVSRTSDKCKVKVVILDGNGAILAQDVSDFYFTITH
jgi:Divergent InlB B-repeat domain